MNGDYWQEDVGILLGQSENIFVGNVEVGFSLVDGSVGSVILVERQYAILAAAQTAAREPGQARDIFLVRLRKILDSRSAGVNEKLPTFQAQPIFGSRTDERAAVVGA